MSAAAPGTKAGGWREQAPLIFPALLLLAFFVVPFGLMIAV